MITSLCQSGSFTGASRDDIAILRLAEEVDLTKYPPACLPRKSDRTTFDGKTALAMGELVLVSYYTAVNFLINI